MKHASFKKVTVVSDVAYLIVRTERLFIDRVTISFGGGAQLAEFMEALQDRCFRQNLPGGSFPSLFVFKGNMPVEDLVKVAHEIVRQVPMPFGDLVVLDQASATYRKIEIGGRKPPQEPGGVELPSHYVLGEKYPAGTHEEEYRK